MRDFQSVIGRETRQQCLQRFGRLPDVIVACVGGGSNAAGMFYPFVEDAGVELVGVEAGGRGGQPGEHASPLTYGRPGVLHGSFSYVMQDEDGQTCDVHSVSAGLDYPGVGPEHSYWKATGRVRLRFVSRRGSAAGLRRAGPRRRDSAGPGIVPCRRPGDASRAAAVRRPDHRRLPVRTR